MTLFSKLLVCAVGALAGVANLVCVTTAQAEVAFPQTRSAVGVDEFYKLEEFENWTIYCLRDANSEDFCLASTLISDHAAGIQLEFNVSPFIDFTAPVPVTVDVAPRAIVEIVTTSRADHYKDLVASIASLDDVFFDGYSCPVTNLDTCDQGPELVLRDIRMLTSSGRARVEITHLRTGELVTEIEVSLSGLYQAYSRANSFTAEVLGFDLTDTRNLGEMCNFINDGIERRISFFLDRDSDFSRPSRREDWLGPRGTTTCPSYVILSYFTPDMTPAQRKLFCLVIDADSGEYLGAMLGEVDQYRVCRAPYRTVCERVNDTRNVALTTMGVAATLTGGGAAATTATGVTVVTHSSGLAILTGGAGYIGGTIGPLAATIGLLTAPIVVAATAISVVGVSGAIYVCYEHETSED